MPTGRYPNQTDMTERRCPNCAKLVAVQSDDFDGDVTLFCPRCKAPFGSETPDLPRLTCRCRRWLASGVVEGGSLRMQCKRCSMAVEAAPTGIRRIETADRPGPKLRIKPIHVADLIPYLEERWAVLGRANARHRAELAVGLRFDVFNRDGFRCRYCGRSVSEGIILEVDHVRPRADGGTDDLPNLVTACWDCNRGKSAKAVLTA